LVFSFLDLGEIIRDLRDSPKGALKKTLKLSGRKEEEEEEEEEGDVMNEGAVAGEVVDEEEEEIRRHLEATREEDQRVLKFLEAQRAAKNAINTDITSLDNEQKEDKEKDPDEDRLVEKLLLDMTIERVTCK
jgi:hypothetical protein